MDIEEDKIYIMPAGMPGFSEMKRFVIIEREETWPFLSYQCVDEPGLCFYIMNPCLFKGDYTINLAQVAREMRWEEGSIEDIKTYVIVNTSAGVPEKITANLLGPLLIHEIRHEAVQVVLHDSHYSHQYLIFGAALADNSCQNEDDCKIAL